MATTPRAFSGGLRPSWGNVMGPAVVVFIGAAFTAIVTLLTFSTTNPLLKAVVGKPNLGYLASVIDILRIAVVMYFFLVLPVHSLMKTPSRQNSGNHGIPQCLGAIPLQATRWLCTQTVV